MTKGKSVPIYYISLVISPAKQQTEFTNNPLLRKGVVRWDSTSPSAPVSARVIFTNNPVPTKADASALQPSNDNTSEYSYETMSGDDDES